MALRHCAGHRAYGRLHSSLGDFYIVQMVSELLWRFVPAYVLIFTSQRAVIELRISRAWLRSGHGWAGRAAYRCAGPALLSGSAARDTLVHFRCRRRHHGLQLLSTPTPSLNQPSTLPLTLRTANSRMRHATPRVLSAKQQSAARSASTTAAMQPQHAPIPRFVRPPRQR